MNIKMQSLLYVRKSPVLSMLIMTILSFGRSQTITSCRSEAARCYSNAVCTSCANVPQALLSSRDIGKDFTTCVALFAYGCSLAEANGCDVTNVHALHVVRCFAEKEAGCSGFTSC